MHPSVVGELVDGGGGNLGVVIENETHGQRAELRSAPSDSSTGLSTTEFNDGSMSGQLGDDRSERISGVGADNEVGEAAVLPPPQDLLGGRRRVAREYRERVRVSIYHNA